MVCVLQLKKNLNQQINPAGIRFNLNVQNIFWRNLLLVWRKSLAGSPCSNLNRKVMIFHISGVNNQCVLHYNVLSFHGT